LARRVCWYLQDRGQTTGLVPEARKSLPISGSPDAIIARTHDAGGPESTRELPPGCRI